MGLGGECAGHRRYLRLAAVPPEERVRVLLAQRGGGLRQPVAGRE